MISEKLLLGVALVSTWYMIGVIWMVQLVHYPLFEKVGRDNFAHYEKAHVGRMSFVVMPAMLIELFSSLGLFLFDQNAIYVGSFVLLVVAWVVTFFFSVPAHRKLSALFDQKAFKSLLQTNWIRALAWSSRGLLLLYALLERVE
jgi:hypothetical protein